MENLEKSLGCYPIFIDMQNFELTASQVLVKYTDQADILKPLLLQSDRAVFLAPKVGLILKVYSDQNTLEKEMATAQKAAAVGLPIPEMKGLERGNPTTLVMEYIPGLPLSSKNPLATRETGKYLNLFHGLGAAPPFSGGQNQWDEFILWWIKIELGKNKQLKVLTETEVQKILTRFTDLIPVLKTRPIVLLHGDLQTNHILVSPQEDKVLGFLDFADAQAGDPLLDIAVLTLWDTELTALVLEGYGTLENNPQTQLLLSNYRLLRHLAEIPWLVSRGWNERAERNIQAIKKLF